MRLWIWKKKMAKTCDLKTARHFHLHNHIMCYPISGNLFVVNAFSTQGSIEQRHHQPPQWTRKSLFISMNTTKRILVTNWVLNFHAGSSPVNANWYNIDVSHYSSHIFHTRYFLYPPLGKVLSFETITLPVSPYRCEGLEECLPLLITLKEKTQKFTGVGLTHVPNRHGLFNFRLIQTRAAIINQIIVSRTDHLYLINIYHDIGSLTENVWHDFQE